MFVGVFSAANAIFSCLLLGFLLPKFNGAGRRVVGWEGAGEQYGWLVVVGVWLV